MQQKTFGGPDHCGGFRAWYYQTTGLPVPANVWDAFGHCYVACCGTKWCGAFATALLGSEYELGRELGLGGPHDSHEQDVNNQALGRRFGDEGRDCVIACRNAALPGGEMDLSAPERRYWDPVSEGCSAEASSSPPP